MREKQNDAAPLQRGGAIKPIPGGRDGKVSQLLLNTKLQSLARLLNYTIKIFTTMCIAQYQNL